MAGQEQATAGHRQKEKYPGPRFTARLSDSLAPVFWYLLPFLGLALVLALTLRQIPLSDTAGMVARGEAVGGEEAERLEAERHAGITSPRGAAASAVPADDEFHRLHG